MHKKIRFVLRFSWAFAAKHYLPLLLGMFFGSAAFFVVPPLTSSLSLFRPVQTIGLVGRYTLSDLPVSILSKLSIGLTTISQNGLPGPGLAQSWQATDEGKTYIFSLNPNLRWHDGTKVKSRDIQYNFRDAQVSYPDDSRLEIRLTDPFSPLPTVVSKPVLKSSSFPKRFSGIGSYRLKTFRKNGSILESITLVPVSSASNLPSLRYHFFSSPAQARTALKLGLVRTLESLTDAGQLFAWPNLEIHPQTHTDKFVAVFFNTADAQFMGPEGKNFRLALTYAINKSRWPESIRAYGPINPTSWAYNLEVKKYDYDPDRSKQLLKKIAPSPPQQISLSSVPAYLEVAENIKNDWESVGLSVNLHISPDIPADFQALLIAQATPLDPDQYNLWHSTQTGTNLTRLNHPRIDKLLEDGRKTSLLEERTQIYRDFQRFLLEEIPAAFLFFHQTFTIVKK